MTSLYDLMTLAGNSICFTADIYTFVINYADGTNRKVSHIQVHPTLLLFMRSELEC